MRSVRTRVRTNRVRVMISVCNVSSFIVGYGQGDTFRSHCSALNTDLVGHRAGGGWPMW